MSSIKTKNKKYHVSRTHFYVFFRVWCDVSDIHWKTLIRTKGERESEEVVASVLVFMLVNDLKGIVCHFIRSSQVGIERGLFSFNLVENWFLTSFLLFLVLGFGMGFLTIVIPYLFFKIKNKNCCLPFWVV